MMVLLLLRCLLADRQMHPLALDNLGFILQDKIKRQKAIDAYSDSFRRRHPTHGKLFLFDPIEEQPDEITRVTAALSGQASQPSMSMQGVTMKVRLLAATDQQKFANLCRTAHHDVPA
jgi:hypothetical protein